MTSPHIQYINALIAKAMTPEALSTSGPITGGEAYALAQEVIRLRSVVAGLGPCLAYVVEEAVHMEREMKEAGVDPNEPALAQLNEALRKLRAMFLDKA
jgi:hypothetical protein